MRCLTNEDQSTVVGHFLTEIVTVPQEDNNTGAGQFLADNNAFENENSLTDQLVPSGQPYGGRRYDISIGQFRLRYESNAGRTSRCHSGSSHGRVWVMPNR